MDLAKYIDHTILRPDATADEIIALCGEAAEHKFAAVCINPCYVDLAAHLLTGTGVKVATVVGFPLGATFPVVKVAETKEAILRKADEIDMVINIGAAKSGNWQAVESEIAQVVNAADDRTVKVIIETALLSEDEKKRACQAVVVSGAHFVKTSTGFASAGATVEDVRLLRSEMGPEFGVKAAGGIRDRQQAEAMIAAGASRLGTSAGVAIIK